LIDKKPNAIETALREIERFKATVGEETGHKGGFVSTFGLDKLDVALKGAWLAVEVGKNSYNLTSKPDKYL
jgi:hypothetical protein